VGGTFQMSDAWDKNSLKGKFKYGSGNILFAQGGYSWGPDNDGRDVHVGEAGFGAGSDAGGAGGFSNTHVSGYIGSFCGNWVCDIFHAK